MDITFGFVCASSQKSALVSSLVIALLTSLRYDSQLHCEFHWLALVLKKVLERIMNFYSKFSS